MKLFRKIIQEILFVVAFAMPVLVFSQNITVSPIIQKENGTEYYLHTVQRGETLYRISKAYELSVDEIIRINPEAQSGIKPLQELKIPRKSSLKAKLPPDSKAGYIYHVVRQGESIEAIALIYNIPSRKILDINPGVILPLQKDQILKIPIDYTGEAQAAAAPKTGEKQNFHVVKPKETLFGISRMHGLSIIDLLAANPKAEIGLKVGDTLKLFKADSQATPNNRNTASNKISVPDNQPVKHHTVQKKETWYGIARQHGLTVDELQKLNPAIITLAPGMEIIVQNSVSQPIVADFHDSSAKTPEPYVADSHHDSATQGSPELTPKVYRTDLMKVALLIPLDLDKKPDTLEPDENEGERIRQHQFRFLPFYEGLLIAADSLGKQGLTVELSTFDVPKDSDRLSTILKKNELKEADVIIGLVYAGDFMKLSDFAAAQGIPLINPLTKRRESAMENKWVIKMQPDHSVRYQAIIDFLANTATKHDFIISRQNKYQLGTEVTEISQAINSLKKNKPSIVGHTTVLVDSVAKLKTLIQKGQSPVVFTLAENPAYVMDYLRKLNNIKDSVPVHSLFGLPDWDAMDKLETQHLERLNVHRIKPFYPRYGHYSLDDFLMKYQSRYSADPNELAFEGFDALWLAGNAHRSGEGIIDFLKKNAVDGILARYRFRVLGENGLENFFWNIYKIEDYKIKVVNR